MYTRQSLTQDHITYNNNTFTHCASTTVDDSQPSVLTSSSATIASSASASASAASSTSTGIGSSVISSSSASNSSTQSLSHSSVSSYNGTNTIATTMARTLSSSSSTSATSADSSSNGEGSLDSHAHPSTLHIGSVVGIVLGIVAFLLLVVSLLCLRKRDSSLRAAATVEPFSSLVVTPPFGKFYPIHTPVQNLAAEHLDRSLLTDRSASTNSHNDARPSEKRRQRGQNPIEHVARSIHSTSPRHSSTAPSRTTSDSEPETNPQAVVSNPNLPLLPERHRDGGVVLQRASSGRLPPAYGEQYD